MGGGGFFSIGRGLLPLIVPLALAGVALAMGGLGRGGLAPAGGLPPVGVALGGVLAAPGGFPVLGGLAGVLLGPALGGGVLGATFLALSASAAPERRSRSRGLLGLLPCSSISRVLASTSLMSLVTRALTFGSNWYMAHCWKIRMPLLTVQYRTTPAGKRMEMTPKKSGMNFIMLACGPWAAAGFRDVIWRCW